MNPVVVIFIILALIILVGSSVVVASMAQKRGRSVIGWVALGFVALPIAISFMLYSLEEGDWGFLLLFFSWPFVIILLLCLGETDEKRKERLEEEALIKWQVWDRQNRLKQKEEEPKSQEPVSDGQGPHTSKTINDLYKKTKQ